ncbi:MAG: transcription termination/antitermination protein NusG [Christensenellales bacterium]|jgi:transcriptional antiterminator NusG
MSETNFYWYVLHTYTGYEHSVKNDLQVMSENNGLTDRIVEIVVPEEDDIVEDKKGKRKVIKRKKFPTYVFIKMNYSNDMWYLITNTRGVTGFVGPQGRPLPLTDEEVKRMGLERMEINDLEIVQGDNVKVITGALEGFIGEVEEIDVERQKIKVSVSMFGRPTPVELDFAQVEKIN